MRTKLAFFMVIFGILWPVAAGAQEWVRRYGTPSWDVGVAIALNTTTGNVYVTGSTSRSQQSPDCYESVCYGTLAYDTTGQLLWEALYQGASGTRNYATAIAVDSSSGNVYVTGYGPAGLGPDGSPTPDDFETVAYDSNGNLLWFARYDGPGHQHDRARAIALDSAGNVYVTGESWGNGNFDYATVAYDPNGTQLWVARYDGPGDVDGSNSDLATAIAVDGSGNVYVTGSSAGRGTGADYATIKYDSASGAELWVSRFNGRAYGDDFATAIALDSAGNIYVTGSSENGRGIGPPPDGRNYDYATVAYSPAGTELWLARYLGPVDPPDGHHRATAITVDGGSNVYVTGSSEIGGRSYYATVKYDSAGTQLWVSRFGESSNNHFAAAIALDNTGHVFVTGESAFAYGTVAIDAATGFQFWYHRYWGSSTTIPDRAHAMVVDGAGYIFITGESWAQGTGYDYATIKYLHW